MKQPIEHSRFCHRIFWFVFAAALIVWTVAAPASLAAQQSAPAATASTAPAAQPAHEHRATSFNTEVTPSNEEDEMNVYRHAEIVHTLARIFHLNVETTARIFEAINFAIIALAIGIPLIKFLPRIIRKRSETLRHNIESARKLTQDANARLSAVEARLSKLDDEIAEIRTHVEDESKQDEVRIKATIEEESSRIVAAAEQEIGLAAAQARRGLQNFAAELSIDRAVKQLELTPETDRALIAEFMREASNGAAKGGKS